MNTSVFTPEQEAELRRIVRDEIARADSADRIVAAIKSATAEQSAYLFQQTRLMRQRYG